MAVADQLSQMLFPADCGASGARPSQVNKLFFQADFGEDCGRERKNAPRHK
jgi:hypothetical protein